MTQLDIFDFIDTEVVEAVAEKEAEFSLPSYSIGDRVRVKKASELSNPDVETVAYLDDFGGLVGSIQIIHVGKVTSYYVGTNKGVAVVHEDEITFIS